MQMLKNEHMEYLDAVIIGEMLIGYSISHSVDDRYVDMIVSRVVASIPKTVETLSRCRDEM
ncbi:MAG: hypothetical protein QXV17_06810 [Candidatus Micrarchaeaceae archaeon]